MNRAKAKLYRGAQMDAYHSEIACFDKDSTAVVERNSILHRYVPFMDELSVLRMKGRTI